MHQLSRVYEDFEPTSDWLCDVEHDTPLVYLPGFSKDQLKVQATSTQKLRIIGERPIGENKWGRFRKEFPISSNYDLNKISAKFEKGILHVKHPKKIIATPATPAAEQHQPPKTSVSQNHSTEVPRPPKIEQSNGSQQQITPKFNPDNRLEDGDTLKPAEKDQPKNIESKKNTNDGLIEVGEGTNTTGKHGNIINKGGTNSYSSKCKLGGYRQAFAKLMAEMKQPRQSASLVMASLIVLVIGMYAKTAYVFHGQAEN